jgi:hypothetical protein
MFPGLFRVICPPYQGPGPTQEDLMIPRQSLAFALFLLAPLAAASGDIVSPGADFNGTYAPEGMTCDGAGRIKVTDGAMVGAEFAISITDVIEFPGEPNKVEVTLLNQGGGGEWVDSAVLTSAEDDRSLRFDYPDGSTVLWNRCD